MTEDNGYTPTQRAILRVLSDGEPHLKEDLLSAMPDDLCSVENLRNHISGLRKRLPPDQYVVCVLRYRRVYYQHVKSLFSGG